MKIYYYMFTPDGNVVKEEIKARKNKSNYAVDAYAEYGGYEHHWMSYLHIKDENDIMGISSMAPNGCYMFSTTIKDITEEMRLFAQMRAKKVKEIMEIQKELENMKIQFNETERDNNT